MRINKIFVVSDDPNLLASIEELLIEPEPSFNRVVLGLLSKETIEPVFAIPKLLEHSKTNMHHFCIVIDGRRLGVSSIVSENITESGGHFVIFSALFPEATVILLASQPAIQAYHGLRIAQNIRALDYCDQYLATSIDGVVTILTRLFDQFMPLYDPWGGRAMLVEVWRQLLGQKSHHSLTSDEGDPRVLILEDDLASALLTGSAAYARGARVCIVSSCVEAASTPGVRVGHSTSSVPTGLDAGNGAGEVYFEIDASYFDVVIADQELQFPDISRYRFAGANVDAVLYATDVLRWKDGVMVSKTIIISGARSEQITKAITACEARGFTFFAKPFRSVENVVAFALTRRAKSSLSNGVVFGQSTSDRVLRHSAPASVRVLAELLIHRCRVLSASSALENLATVTVLAHQAHMLLALANDRTAITTDAFLLSEEAGARIELLVSGASGQVEVAQRIARLLRFGTGRFDDASIPLAASDIVDLNSLLRVVTSLKRLYAANEQIVATESFIRLSARIQRFIKRKYINSPDKNLWRRIGEFFTLWGTTYVDFATDNGISITRLFEVIGAWWLVLTVCYGILFFGTGMSAASASRVAAMHAAAVLVFYPEATGTRSLAEDPTTRKFAEAMRSVCITDLPDILGSKVTSREEHMKNDLRGECLKLSFLNTTLNFLGRVISITHISLIASILFRRIMYRAN